jgi:hypothetical protein
MHALFLLTWQMMTWRMTGLMTCRMTVQNCWRGCWLAAGVAGQPGSVAENRVKTTRGERGASGRAWAVLSSARAGMQYVGSSTGFHQWIPLFFLYAMVMSKTRVENFYFWVWIKHPLFQEQALIPVVGKFQNSNTHQFTLFGNLPTPRSYWFVLIKLRNNTNNKTKEEEKIFSTQLKLSLSRFSLCVFTLLCVLHTPTLQLFTKHTYILS